MAYIMPEVIAKVKEIDLLTYLENAAPQEIVKISGNCYCTREHDSLKISNGKWHWFSRGIGGRTALDYLIKVKEMSFKDAVTELMDFTGSRDIVTQNSTATPKAKTLLLPKKNSNNNAVYRYLQGRSIDVAIITDCIKAGKLYESEAYHNAVFVGYDSVGTARYANIRGTSSDFKGECNGSDKRYSFCFSCNENKSLHLFESAIDLLSYATLLKATGKDPYKENLLSLAGVYAPKTELQESSLPLVIRHFLLEHPTIEKIHLHLDNDRAGRFASAALVKLLSPSFEVFDEPPPMGKDCNDYLCMKLGLPVNSKNKGEFYEQENESRTVGAV